MAGRRRVAKVEAPQVIAANTFAGKLSDKWLKCRELGHQWRPHTATYDEKARCYDRTLNCPNCHTKRIQVLDRSGFVLKNKYEYPEGYLAANVAPGFGREVFRLEAVIRSMGLTERKVG